MFSRASVRYPDLHSTQQVKLFFNFSFFLLTFFLFPLLFLPPSTLFLLRTSCYLAECRVCEWECPVCYCHMTEKDLVLDETLYRALRDPSCKSGGTDDLKIFPDGKNHSLSLFLLLPPRASLMHTSPRFLQICNAIRKHGWQSHKTRKSQSTTAIERLVLWERRYRSRSRDHVTQVPSHTSAHCYPCALFCVHSLELLRLK